jgi:hydroxymethylpyrimidine/phosphomethylpyrimidine kinase
MSFATPSPASPNGGPTRPDPMPLLPARVLVVAGSDSGGGAGIQADIKTITALGGFAATAITALTAQNTLGVQGIWPVPVDFLRLQIGSVLDDIGTDVVKTGMLGDAATIAAVAEELAQRIPAVPVVVDPVMVAKGGARLLAADAVTALTRRLVPLARIITPNLLEAEVLAGMTIPDLASMRRAAAALLTLGAPTVLLKGGHLPGDTVVDLLATEAGVEEMAAPRIETRHTHGTGCTLASAIAVGLGQGMELAAAVRRARAFVRAAMAGAPGFGAGHGPMDHTVTVDVGRLP